MTIDKEEVETYLIEHQFDDWEWNDAKKYLKVYKLGRNWKVPYYELLYSVVFIDIIFKEYIIDYIK